MTTILVIDDDNDVKESSQVMLMDEGFETVLACDGNSGIEQYEKNHPDMTFLDIKMPGKDGFEVFDKIKEKDSQAKITFITGYETDDKKILEAKEKGLIDVINKPVEFKDLLKIIQKNC